MRIIVLGLSIIFVACSSCTCSQQKEETSGEVATVEAEKPFKAMPSDEVHSKLKKDVPVQLKSAPNITAGENGELFVKPKKTPITIIRMQGIANQEKTALKEPYQPKKADSIYQANCSRCHGVDGKGEGPMANDLAIAPTNLREWEYKFGFSLHEIVYTLTYGQSEGEMPSFRKTLSERELWLVAKMVADWKSGEE
ncbi:MAG: cytochrome c [Pseudobacteriovorax sp.]|nr:cytochrome c [Pseudobacteriovorax sp.]